MEQHFSFRERNLLTWIRKYLRFQQLHQRLCESCPLVYGFANVGRDGRTSGGVAGVIATVFSQSSVEVPSPDCHIWIKIYVVLGTELSIRNLNLRVGWWSHIQRLHNWLIDHGGIFLSIFQVQRDLIGFNSTLASAKSCWEQVNRGGHMCFVPFSRGVSFLKQMELVAAVTNSQVLDIFAFMEADHISPETWQRWRGSGGRIFALIDMPTQDTISYTAAMGAAERSRHFFKGPRHWTKGSHQLDQMREEPSYCSKSGDEMLVVERPTAGYVFFFWWVGVAKRFFTTTSGKVILNGVFVSPWAGPSKSICFPSFLLFAQG